MLIILPIILLIAVANGFKTTKDFLFALLAITISMMVTFFVKLGYYFIYKKIWKNGDNFENKREDSQEKLFGLQNL